MKLTPKQDALISRFLRDVNMHLDAGISEQIRELGLMHIQQNIHQQLDEFDNADDNIPDEQLYRVLRDLGSPQSLAALINEDKNQRQKSRNGKTSPVWLGVCAWVAEIMDQDPRLIRLLVFVLGMTTGPIALFAYIGVFTYLHNMTDQSNTPPLRKWPIIGQFFLYNTISLALHIGSGLFLKLVFYLYESYFQQTIPDLAEWGWLDAWKGTLLFIMLAFGIPISILSGLPLANGWNISLRRFLQAMLALYAVILCFGLASMLVGLLLDSIDEIRPMLGQL